MTKKKRLRTAVLRSNFHKHKYFARAKKNKKKKFVLLLWRASIYVNIDPIDLIPDDDGRTVDGSSRRRVVIELQGRRRTLNFVGSTDEHESELSKPIPPRARGSVAGIHRSVL